MGESPERAERTGDARQEETPPAARASATVGTAGATERKREPETSAQGPAEESAEESERPEAVPATAPTSGASVDVEDDADAAAAVENEPGARSGNPAEPERPAERPAEQPDPRLLPRLDAPTTALRVPRDDATRTLRHVRPAEPAGPATAEGRGHPDTEGADQASAPARPGTTAGDEQKTVAVPRPSGASAVPPAAPPAPSGAPSTGGPRPEPAPQPGPETTSEAMEILAGLSARPMTPVRAALRRIRLWGTLLLVLALVLAVVQVLRPLPSPELQLTADPSYAFDGSTPTLDWPAKGQATAEVVGLGSLGHSGSDNPVPIASVTKVMTAYQVLKDHPLKLGEQGPTITVDQQAVDDYTKGGPQGESVVKVELGETITEYQALQMLLIPSANNIARLLGRWDAGSDAAFVRKMQASATALGMSKTTYTDPSGLDGTTRSTANDQLKLAEKVMQDPVFAQVVGTASFTPPLASGVIYNNNALLQKNGVIGIKTGSSTAALGCLMWAAQQKVGEVTKTVLGVVLSQPATAATGGYLPSVLTNSKKLVVSAENALEAHQLVKKGQVVGYVDDGLGGHTPVVADQDLTVVGWGGLSVSVTLEPVTGGVPHSAKAGAVVGSLVVGNGSTGTQTTTVSLQSDLAEPSYGARLTRLG